MSKPEYGTIEYARQYIGEWWINAAGNRYYLIGFSYDGRPWHQHKSGSCFTGTLDNWFSNNNRPESDPAPVKRKVECEAVSLIFSRGGGLWGVGSTAEHAEIEAKDLNGVAVHIPATTIEVEA